MFTEIIEPLQYRPGPAALRRRLTNLLHRIKIELFGAEALEPGYLMGKDVRALNTQLVEGLIYKMLSQRDSLIETVFQPEPGKLNFYVLLKIHNHDTAIQLCRILGDYEMLEIAERYPVWFDFIPHHTKDYYLAKNLPIFYKKRNAATYKTSKAQPAYVS